MNELSHKSGPMYELTHGYEILFMPPKVIILSHAMSCSGQLKMTYFCTKMKFSPFYMIFRGTGAGQHYFVAFLSLLSPQARGASVMSLLFQPVLKGICDEFMAI